MGVGDKEAKKKEQERARILRGGIEESDTKAPETKAFDPIKPFETAAKGLAKGIKETLFGKPPPPPPPPPPAAPDLTDEMLRKRAVAELLQQKTKRGLSSTFSKKPGKGLLGE